MGVVGALVGTLSASNHLLALGAAVVLLIVGLAAVDLGIVVALSVPAVLLVPRIGPVSISDAVLAVSTIAAIVMLRRDELTPIRPLLWGGTVYLASLLPTLVLNRYRADVIEWVHELVLVLGSLVVGWVTGRGGHARLALGTYVGLCVGLSIAAIATALTMLAQGHGFGPAYVSLPGIDFQKNMTGDVLSFAAIFVYARPPWLRWNTAACHGLLVLFALGIAASGARQAMVAAGIGILFVNVRGRVTSIKRTRLIWFALVPVGYFILHAVIDQLQSTNKFNSSNQRLAWFGDSMTIWHQSPLFGVGLRWWYTPRFPVAFQPPNAELEMLSSAGLVGTAGFLIMFAVAFWVLGRLNPTYGTIALATVLARFVQGQLDLYWLAGLSSILWIVAGIAYGVERRESDAAHDDSSRPDRADLAGTSAIP